MAATRRATAPRRRRTTSEQQILDATAALLREGQRLPDMSVHDIIDSAGVSRSTFYQHFSSKTDLAFRLAGPAMSAARATSDRWWREPSWGSSADMVEIVRSLMAQGREYRLEWLTIFDIADRDADAAAGVEAMVRDYVSQMAQRLVSEQESGQVSPAVDPPQLGRLILITTRACILDQLAHGDPENDETFAATLGHMLWLAIRQQ